MSIEPGIVDANILVYAMDADALRHIASRTLLEAARDKSARVYVTLQILCEFYSIVTNARRVHKPRPPSDALAAISSLLTFLHVLPVPGQVVDGWLGLLRRRAVIGGDIFDLQLVATMLANGNESILSIPMTLKFFLN
jgi:predicted nucleic acid-binding protein